MKIILAAFIFFFSLANLAQADMSLLDCYLMVDSNKAKIRSDSQILATCPLKDGILPFDLCACHVLDGRNDPLVLERRAAAKRSAIQASCSDNSWGDLPSYLNGVPLLIPSKLACKGYFCGQLQTETGCEEKYKNTGKYNLEQNVLKTYCQENFPQSVGAAYSENNDVSAAAVSLWTPSYIKEKWAGKEGYYAQVYQGANIDVLMDLNLEAAGIWEEILSCYKGNAEKSRRAYFEAKIECTDGNFSGELIREKIKTLLINVENYFTSSSFPKSAVACTNPMEVARMLARDETSITNPPPAFPSLHPLFIQASLQALLQMAPVGRRVSMSEFATGMQNGVNNLSFFNALSQLSGWIPESECSTFGLWPSAGRSAIRALKATSLKLVISVPQIGKLIHLKDYNFSPVGCVDKVLPDFYATNSDSLAIEMGRITERYKNSAAATPAAKRCLFRSCR